MKKHYQHYRALVARAVQQVSKGNITFVRFSIVGALGVVWNLLFLFLLVEYFYTNHLPASIFAIEISIIHNFLLNNFWTFSERSLENSILKRFLNFNLLSLTTLIVNTCIAMALINLGAWYILAQAAGIICAFFINYLLNNCLVFAGIREPESRAKS